MSDKHPPSDRQLVDLTGTQTSQLTNPELARSWLSAIIDSADDAIITKTLDGIITSWNKSAERIFGYSAEEAIGKSITILIPPSQTHEEHIILSRIRNGERVEHYETVRLRKDGKAIQISLTVSPIRTSDGKIIGASKIARDVTEQRKAQQRLKESSERLSLALSASQLGDWSWDPKTDLVNVSETVARIYGIAPGPHLTRNEMRQLIHVEDRERVRNAVDNAIERRAEWDIEFRIIRDGEPVWLSGRGRGLFDNDGTLLTALGFVQDISRQKEIEQKLRDQAQALETLNKVNRIISAELDLHKIVRAVTSAATELTKARVGSFLYNAISDDGGSYELFTFAGPTQEAFEHFPMPRATDLVGSTLRHEGIVRIADVKLHPRYGKNSPYFGMTEEHLPVTSYLAVPVVSRSGEVLGGLFCGHPEQNFFTDKDEQTVAGLAAQAAIAMDNARLYESTKRARSEAERSAIENERLYRQAEESSRLKEEFLATISHELRTPLNAILGWARILRTGQLTGENASKALDTIERNARAQSQLINDLLDVSRIITGKLRIDVVATDPASFIDAAVEALRPAAEAKDVRVHKIFDTGVVPVLGDPVRLQQVVWNLLSNAIKFTPRRGHVRVILRRVDSHIEILVSDTGEGITPEFLPHVFDRFRQADQKTSRRHGGMGLGLAIVRHLVELHGGQVKAASDGEDKGASFTVMLPIVPVYQVDLSEGTHPAARDPNAAPPDCIERLDGMKILVVDDERDTRELLKEGLEYCGAEVSLAASAAEALQSIKATQPDVLISDIGMPEEDGHALIRKVRMLDQGDGGNVPAIALTAYTRVEDRLKALRSGYQMHVPKPVELAELVTVAASLMRRDSSRS